MSNQYEKYMQEKLGIDKKDENLYVNYNQMNESYLNNNFDNDIDRYKNISMLENSYPKIYNEIYPFVDKVCKKYENRDINNNLIDIMSDEIYNQIIESTNNASLKNNILDRGNKNNFLVDLITIILINELISNCKNKKNKCNHKMPPKLMHDYCGYNVMYNFNNPMLYSRKIHNELDDIYSYSREKNINHNFYNKYIRF